MLENCRAALRSNKKKHNISQLCKLVASQMLHLFIVRKPAMLDILQVNCERCMLVLSVNWAPSIMQWSNYAETGVC